MIKDDCQVRASQRREKTISPSSPPPSGERMIRFGELVSAATLRNCFKLLRRHFQLGNYGRSRYTEAAICRAIVIVFGNGGTNDSSHSNRVIINIVSARARASAFDRITENQRSFSAESAASKIRRSKFPFYIRGRGEKVDFTERVRPRTHT